MKSVTFASFALSCSVAFAGPDLVGFNSNRAGAVALDTGTFLSQFRTAVTNAYSGATFRGVETLSAPGFNGANVTLLCCATGGTSAISPLSAAEQSALHAFVLGGRGALIFTDNDSFAGGASQPANLSLLAPWGVTCVGTGFAWARNVLVTNPHASPVTDGPFGTVSSYPVGWSGWYNGLGPAASLATLQDNSQPALLVIPRGALGVGSGAVVLFSDSTMLVDGFISAANQTLFLNALAYVAGPSCKGDLNNDGVVDDQDFTIFVVAYNLLDCADPAMPSGCPSDLNGDTLVDDSDFVIFVAAYNELVCP